MFLGQRAQSIKAEMRQGLGAPNAGLVVRPRFNKVVPRTNSLVDPFALNSRPRVAVELSSYRRHPVIPTFVIEPSSGHGDVFAALFGPKLSSSLLGNCG